MRLFGIIPLLSILVIVFYASSMVAVPAVEWSKTFGGTKDDGATSIQQTSDGGYIAAGWSYSYEAQDSDIWILKTDAKGKMQWDRVPIRPGFDRASSIQQTRDGGYIIAGSKSLNGTDALLIKTDPVGNNQWERIFGGDGNEDALSVRQTSDGGYVIAGTTSSYSNHSDAWLIKTDEDGNEDWSKIIGGTKDGVAQSIQQTVDRGYIIAGWTDSYEDGRRVAWLIKVDANGSEQWNRTFTGQDGAYASSVQQTSDGGYIIGATLWYTSGDSDAWLIKTDSDGYMQWNRTFRWDYYNRDSSVLQTLDGGYILAGSTDRPLLREVGLSNAWIVKTDLNGNEQWNETLRGTWYSLNILSARQTKDEGYILAGVTGTYGIKGYDAWLVKLSGEQTGAKKTQVADMVDHPTGKAIGFEIALSITIFLAVYMIKRNRW